MQHYPFLGSLDCDLDRRCLQQARNGLERRPEAAPFIPADLIRSEEAALAPAGAAARRLAEAAGLTPQPVWFTDYLWKMHGVPPDARHILSIGCGSGLELLFLAARCPQARITAIDWVDNLSPRIAQVTGVKFVAGDLNRIMEILEGGFDIVFSNHVLEHFYEPEVMLDRLRRLLRPGGRLVAALPLDGAPDGPFAGFLRHRAANPAGLHPMDLSILDLGHPWKTEPGDLAATLQSSGFDHVQMFRRPWQPVRPPPSGDNPALRSRRLYQGLNGLFRLAAGLIRRLYPDECPRLLVRLLFALERQVPFGANRLINALSPEVLVTAATGTDPSLPSYTHP